MTDFHFIRPLWLLALIVLIWLIHKLKRQHVAQSGWQQLIPQHLAKVLVEHGQQGKKSSWFLPFIIGFIAIIAMAGPTWQKLPQPVYQVDKGSVLVMDMSYSMYATDISPNRLTRARYKAIDLLNELNDGEIGLVAYAGDAFIISPLTDDSNNIKLLLPSLSPDLMPEPGSNPLAALTLADEMLKNAGYKDGDIFWFTDGIDAIDQQDLIQWTRAHPYRLNILGVGTRTGAPIKLSNGQLMKDNNGAIIVPKLTGNLLQSVAKQGSGQYITLQHNNRDIELLLKQSLISDAEKKRKQSQEQTGDQWQEFGPYLLLFILPLVLTYFRRGVLLCVASLALLMMPSPPVYAGLWQDLWQTKDQQAQQQFAEQQYQQAANTFQDPLWQGSAHYKAGDYEQALKAFQQHDSAQALYNQGNALAKLQRLDEAIKAYDQALARDPNLTDAKENKAILEKLKQQQEQQQNQENQQSDNDSEQQQDQDNSQQEGQQQGEQQQSDQQQKSQNSESDNDNAEQNQQNQNQQNDQQNENAGQSADANEDKAQNNDQKNQQQSAEDSDKESDKEKEQQQAAKQQQAQQASEEKNTEDKQPLSAQQAQQAAQLKEQQMKHQQLLNKVTDDPYLLLRNKMQLEYKKRRHNNSRARGAKKKW